MFKVTFTTRSYELDSLGHVNNAVYLNYLECCRMQWLASHHIYAADFQKRHIFPVIANININYIRELTDGQSITVTVKTEEQTARKIIFYQTILNETGILCAEAHVTVVWLGPDRKVIPPPVDHFPKLFEEDPET